MIERNEKLLVSWKSPQSKRNYFVGLLSKHYNPNGLHYKFIYTHDVVRQAEKEGFLPFIGLKDLDKEYVSNKLFSVFERRLPNQSRHVFKKFIHEHGLETSDAVTWEYLKVTKGKTATDNLSLLEPVYIEKDQLNYRGEIAGWSYTKDNNKNLKINDQLILRNEESNPDDTMAVEIIDQANADERVGYIQKPFNQVFFNLLKKGYSLSGYVYSIDFQEKRPTIRIEEKVSIKDIKGRGLDYLIQ